MPVQPHLPEPLATWLRPFMADLTQPTWCHALTLVAGAVLAPGRRTVAGILRVMGLGQLSTFTNYHRVLNRNRWSSRVAAKRLLHLLLGAFVPDGPVIIGIDETIERRWGAKIKARGIYREPVRSSHGHFVPRGACAARLWRRIVCVDGQRLALDLGHAARAGLLGRPVLTALAPSARLAHQQGRRHKKLTDWARQLLVLAARWLPERRLIAVADSSYAAIELLAARLRSPHHDHPAPARCPAVRPATATPAGHHRPAASVGRASADPGRAPDGSQDPLAARHGHGLVWPNGTADRAELGHSALVPSRQAGADPLASGAGCADEFEPQGFLSTDLDATARDAALVRAALVGRGDVRRSAPAARGGDAAAVVRSGDRAHHAGGARLVLAADTLDRGRARRRCRAATCRLLSQAAADLQRCARCGPLSALDLGDFIDLTRSRRGRQNPSWLAKTAHSRRLLPGPIGQSQA